MDSSSQSIPFVAFIDSIDDICKEYLEKYGCLPFNVSDWNPSEYTKKEMSKYLIPQDNSLIFEYQYSHCTSHVIRESIDKKLCLNHEGRRSFFVSNGTHALSATMNLLQQLNIHDLIVLNPAYFIIPWLCRIFNVETINLFLERNNGGYFIKNDERDLFLSKKCALITNPIYGTSVYYDNQQITFFKKYLDEGGILIADECLAIHGKELSSALGDRENFIGIYAPYKHLCVNAFKFSMINSVRGYVDIIDQWSDILCGGMTASNTYAMQWFLGEYYNIASNIFNGMMKESKEFILERAADHREIEVDTTAEGLYMMVYFKNISSRKNTDLNFIRHAIERTAVGFYPWNIMHNSNFCIRIKLANNCSQYRVSIARLFGFLCSF